MGTKAITRWRSGLETHLAVVVLVAIGALLRLPWLDFPDSIVFDELHFGKYAIAYCCTHEYFFDIHPPHAKLLLAGAAALGGYEGDFGFDAIGLSYPPEVPVVLLRLVPAIAGILLPLAILAIVRQLGGSLAVAFAAGFLVVWDSAVWVQTQYILLDGWLWLSLITSVACLLRAQRLPSMRERAPWLVFCGLAMGMAVGTKFTGLTAGVVVLALLLDELLDRKTGAAILFFGRQCLWIGFPFLLIYLGGWGMHFQLLDEAGSGFSFYRPSGDFFRDLVRLHQVMLAANYNLTVSHPDASSWWTWPFMAVPVLYWDQAGRVIYLAGNPLVWWGTTSVAFTALMLWLLQPVTRVRLPEFRPSAMTSEAADSSRPPLLLWVPLLGYVAAYMPMAEIPRSLFLYHYMPAFLFALIFSVLWLERCGWTLADRSLREQPRGYWGVLVGAVAGFLLMLPLTSGLAAVDGWRSFLFDVFPLWR